MKDPLDRYHRPADSALSQVAEVQRRVMTEGATVDQQRAGSDAALRQQGKALPPEANDAKVPLKGEALVSAMQPPPQNAGVRPVIADSAKVVGSPEPSGPAATDPQAQVIPPSRNAPSPEAMEKAVLEGKAASQKLSHLTQGKVKPGQPVVPPMQMAEKTSKGDLRQALIQQLSLGTQKSVDAPLPQVVQESPKTLNPATEQPVMQQAVANPFVKEPQAPRDIEREDREPIATNRETAGELSGLESGLQRVVVAARGNQEFSGGGHNGGFGDPDGDSPGLAQKVSAVPLCPYGESGDYAVETNELCKYLVYSSDILGGGIPMKERISIAAVDKRMDNTQDGTSLKERVKGSEKDHSQIAEGTRGSIFGPGRIVA